MGSESIIASIKSGKDLVLRWTSLKIRGLALGSGCSLEILLLTFWSKVLAGLILVFLE